MSDEAWLIGRKVDASKKIFVATKTIVFDFELFIGELREKKKSSRLFQAVSSLTILGVLIFSKVVYCARDATSSVLRGTP